MNIYTLDPGAVREPTFHAGFEIVTIVTGGSLRRTGSFAPIQLMRAGAVELVSAGSGSNLGLVADGEEPATYIEFWVRSNAPTRRARRQCLGSCPTGDRHPVAAGTATGPGTLQWRADARLERLVLAAGETLERAIGADASGYAVILAGEISGNDVRARTDDGLACSGPGRLAVRALRASEILFLETAQQGH